MTDDEAETVVSKLEPTAGELPASGSASSPGLSSVSVPGARAIVSFRDALQRDERVRYRLLGYLGLSGSVVVALTVPLLDAGAWPTLLLLASVSTLFLANVVLLYQVSSPERFRRPGVMAVWVIATFGVLGTIAFFGLFSAAVMSLLLGIYVVSRSTLPGVALSVYLTGAIGHALLVLGVWLELVPDGLVRASELEPLPLVALELLVQGLLLGSWLSARRTQVEMQTTLDELDGAVRGAALRQALLDEVRMDFDRAAQLGRPGRLTDARLGAFLLREVIGRGAMGEIYVGTTTDGREAAVKVLFPHLLQDSDMRARFVRESKAVLSLDSPHVVRVLAVGTPDEGLPFLAMERLRGTDLAEHLRTNMRLAPDECAELAAHVALGLAAAARAGIVHRDIKPQNLFRTTEGDRTVWKILDFGVSRLGTSSGTLTSGKLVGTPRYMAPEQAAGAEVDGRADLYALGAVLYRCLVGRPPYPGKEVHRLLYLVVHEMPAQPSSVAALGSDVDAFFALALAKDPARRLEASRFVDAFQRALASDLDPELRARAASLTRAWPWSRRA